MAALPGVGGNFKEEKSGEVAKKAQNYTDLFAHSDAAAKDRVANAQTMVNYYYDLATDFYEYGWGTSFHFALRHNDETHDQSIIRHEHYLAYKMGIKDSDLVLDLGCGVGGPARNISHFTGCKVVGLNNNDYQLTRLKKHTERQGLSDKVTGFKGDFMNIQLEPESFDKAYAIEATCHAPDRTKCFSEIFKVLKPGGIFGGYEWVHTDKCKPESEEHKEILHNIMVGDGLPYVSHYSDVLNALKNAGFEIVEAVDLADPAEMAKRASSIPWYDVLVGGWSLEKIKTSSVGTWCTDKLVRVLEYVGLAPKGTVQTHEFLIKGKEGLVAGGKAGIFTPMYFFIARKPDGKKNN